jgi:hypothetical protein
MPFAYRLEDYARYAERVGDATYIDITRRTDPARVPAVWGHLREMMETYGAPWVAQLWTKDSGGALHQGGALLYALRQAGTTLTAQVTVTGLAGSEWEPLTPPAGLSAIPDLIDLLGSPAHIKWRYDPIIPGVHRPERFRALAAQAADLGLTQGVINFVAPPGRYIRVDKRLAALIPGWAEGLPGYDDAWRRATAAELVAIAGEYGLRLACCAESFVLGLEVPGLGRAACGDYAWFVSLSGRDPGRLSIQGSRPGCGCARYFDVGDYGHWAHCHRCVYCYAG